MKNYKEIQKFKEEAVKLTEDMCNASVINIDEAFNIGYKQGYIDGKEAEQQEYATALHDIEDTYIKRLKAEYEGSYEDEDGKKYPFEDASIFDVAYSKGLQHGQKLRVAEADCAYQCGMKRAWEAARRIYDIQNAEMVQELFGADANYIIYNFTASEVIKKIETREKKQKQIEKSCSTCANLSEENEYTDFCWDECDNKSEWTPKQDAIDIHAGSIENRDKIVKAVAGLLAAYGEQLWVVVADMQKNP